MQIRLKRLLSKTVLSLRVKYLQPISTSREALQPGNQIAGPAVITEFSATTVIPPNFAAVVDAYHNLILTKK